MRNLFWHNDVLTSPRLRVKYDYDIFTGSPLEYPWNSIINRFWNARWKTQNTKRKPKDIYTHKRKRPHDHTLGLRCKYLHQMLTASAATMVPPLGALLLLKGRQRDRACLHPWRCRSGSLQCLFQKWPESCVRGMPHLLARSLSIYYLHILAMH